MTRSRRYDAIVVGGGPAGSSTATLLARAGLAVLVLDRARFPREKACAEFLSPEAARPLARLGAIEAIERATHARLTGLLVRAPDGSVVRGDYLGAHGHRAYRDFAFALPRTTLDPLLLDGARRAGAEVREGVRVADLHRDSSGRAAGVTLADGTMLQSRLVVGADGLRSIVARRLGLARRAAWPRRLGLVAHFRDVHGVGPLGEMHVEHDGFVGIADVGGGLTNVAMVVPARRGREVAGDPAAFMERWLRARAHLRGRLAGATRATAVRATGPFAAHARRAWAPGAALVGDAADFFDPFTGEGIYAALRGGELLADTLLAHEAFADARRLDAALARYHAAHVREFRGKWIVERIIGASVAWAPAVNRAARALAARRDLADLLVGVVGDFVPPSRVLTPGYLYDVFVRSPRPIDAARP